MYIYILHMTNIHVPYYIYTSLTMAAYMDTITKHTMFDVYDIWSIYKMYLSYIFT